jgi:integrase
MLSSHLMREKLQSKRSGQRESYARYNLNRTTALLTGFYLYPKNPFKSLRPDHRLVFLSIGADCLVKILHET